MVHYYTHCWFDFEYYFYPELGFQNYCLYIYINKEISPQVRAVGVRDEISPPHLKVDIIATTRRHGALRVVLSRPLKPWGSKTLDLHFFIRTTEFTFIYLNNLKNTYMSKFPIKSIFAQIADQVFTMKNVNEAKQFITEFVDHKDINDEDKKLILRNISSIKTLDKVQNYICNSLLKYEGLSVNFTRDTK